MCVLEPAVCEGVPARWDPGFAAQVLPRELGGIEARVEQTDEDCELGK